MNKPEQRAIPTSTLIPLDSHAAATLRYIRSSMEAATAFTVPGSAGLAMGAVGLLATMLSLAPGFAVHWLGIWVGAAFIAAMIGGALIFRPDSIHRLALSGTPIRKFVISLAPSLAVGAMLTAVLSARGALDLVPGTWLLLYGSALISASVATTRTIGAMGASFMLLGLLALLLPANFQLLALGAGFGGLHVLFGWWISQESHEHEG